MCSRTSVVSRCQNLTVRKLIATASQIAASLPLHSARYSTASTVLLAHLCPSIEVKVKARSTLKATTVRLQRVCISTSHHQK
eukprot:12670-Heterococcus_DN1.PRE.2